MAGAAAGMPQPQSMMAEPWVLSICTLAVIALTLGAVRTIRRGQDLRQGWLMLIAAAVLLGNVLIWALV